MKQNKMGLFGLVGILSASAALAQTAANADSGDQAPQAMNPTSISDGASANTLSTGDQSTVQDSVNQLQQKYDAQTLGTLVLQIKEGKLVIVGIRTPSGVIDLANPSGI